MTTRWTLAVAGALALATYAPAVPRAVAQQDAGAARTDTGTGRIAGLVVTDETPPRAVRRALVSLTGDHLRVSRHAITDDEGRFELRDLPPGRYALVAARPAYVSVNYGAAGPRRPGTGLVLRDGEVLTGVRLVLQRGAAIAGLVRDAQGDPVPDVQVGLARRGPDDEWTKTDAVTRTDDRGAYRLWGLPAGDYLVLARLTTAGLGEFRPLSTSAVDRALGELRVACMAPRTWVTARFPLCRCSTRAW